MVDRKLMFNKVKIKLARVLLSMSVMELYPVWDLKPKSKINCVRRMLL